MARRKSSRFQAHQNQSQLTLEMEDRIRFLEQRTKIYDSQLTTLVAKLQSISGWVEAKFGADFNVRPLHHIELEDIPSSLLQKIKARSLPDADVVPSAAPPPTSDNYDSDVQVIEDLDDEPARKVTPVPVAAKPHRSGNDSGRRSTLRDRSTLKKQTFTPIKSALPVKPAAAISTENSGKLKQSKDGPKGNRTKGMRRAGSVSTTITLPDGRRVEITNRKCPWPGCSYRPKTGRRDHVVAHLRTHTGERPYACQVPHCGKSYSWGNQLVHHYRTHHSHGGNSMTSRTAKYRRRKCSGPRVRAQPKLQSQCPPEELLCGLCGRRYGSRKILATHIRIQHTKEQPFACKICRAKFFHKPAMRLHMLSFHN